MLKRSLIIGAGGFVGKYLFEHLSFLNQEIHRTFIQREYEMIKDKTNCYNMDISNIEEIEEVLAEVAPDAIYNLAAQASVGYSWNIPQQTLMVNTIGFINLMEVCKKVVPKARILAIGSSEEYGVVAENMNPIIEDTPLNPANPYSISKYAQELFGNLYTKAYGLDLIQVRSFNHIGPGQKEGFVVSDFAKKIVMIEKNLIDPVLYVGNLEAKRDFTDVRDVVRAYELLINKGKRGELYNVGSNKAFSISHIVDIMKGLARKSFKIEIDKSKFRPIDAPIIQCDNSKIVGDTGWLPTISIEQTLEDTLDYYRKII